MKKSKTKINKRGFIILIFAAILQFGSLALQQYVIQLEGNIRNLQEEIPLLNNKLQNLQSNYLNLASLNSEYLEAIQLSINLGLYSDNIFKNFINYTENFMSLTLNNLYIREHVEPEVINNFKDLKLKISSVDTKNLEENYGLFENYLYEIMTFYREIQYEVGKTFNQIDETNIIINQQNNNKQIYLLVSIVLEIVSFLLVLIFFKLFIKRNLSGIKKNS